MYFDEPKKEHYHHLKDGAELPRTPVTNKDTDPDLQELALEIDNTTNPNTGLSRIYYSLRRYVRRHGGFYPANPDNPNYIRYRLPGRKL